MIDWETVRLPIVIISSARSGSTVLANHIQKKIHGVPRFIEPEKDKNYLSEFISLAENSKKYISKIHIDSFGFYPLDLSNYLRYSDEPYRISIERRNKVNQCLSFYIEKHRQRWIYSEGDAFKREIIPVNYQLLEESVKYIMLQNKMVSESNIKFDLSLVYENCNFENTGVGKTPKPKNYDQLHNEITKIFNNYKKA